MHLAEYGISDSDLVNIPGMADLRRKIEETAARVDLTMATQRRNTRSVEEVTMGIDSSMDSSMSKMLNEHGIMKEAINIFSGLKGMLERAKGKTGIDFFMERYCAREERDKKPLHTYEERLHVSIHSMMVSAKVKDEIDKKSREIFYYVLSHIATNSREAFNRTVIKLNIFLQKVLNKDEDMTNADLEKALKWCEYLEAITLGKISQLQ